MMYRNAAERHPLEAPRDSLGVFYTSAKDGKGANKNRPAKAPAWTWQHRTVVVATSVRKTDTDLGD